MVSSDKRLKRGDRMQENKTIWKYTLDPVDIQTLKMPEGSVILSCQLQKVDMCIWAIVDPLRKKVERYIEVIGTENNVNETVNVKRIFIDTVQMHGGDLVWHVFERILK